MPRIETCDRNGFYRDETARGVFGCRHASDRRYWIAWASNVDHSQDILDGVMDDFGNLVPVNIEV
jgi:hypothetical protein